MYTSPFRLKKKKEVENRKRQLKPFNYQAVKHQRLSRAAHLKPAGVVSPQIM